MRRSKLQRAFRAALLLVALSLAMGLAMGCGDMRADAPLAGGDGTGPGGGQGGSRPGEDDSGEGGGIEEEEEFVLATPQASRNFVWIANETRGTLVRLRLFGGAVQIASVPVGARPVDVVARPDDDQVAVLNRDSDTVSIVRADVATGSAWSDTADILPAANRLQVSAGGRWVAAWFDARAWSTGERVGSLSELSLLEVGSAGDSRGEGRIVKHLLMSVGSGIIAIHFTADEEALLVMTEEGVSRVELGDLDGDAFVPPIRGSSGRQDGQIGDAREFWVSPSGNSVVVRTPGESSLRVVDTLSRRLEDLEFDAVVTDIDAIPGTNSFTVAIGSDGFYRVDFAPFETGGSLGSEWVGVPELSLAHIVVSDDGEVLALSAGRGAKHLVLLAAEGGSPAEFLGVSLLKGIESLRFLPGGRQLLVFHTREPGEPVAGEPEDRLLAKSWAFSLIDVTTGESKLFRLEGTLLHLAAAADDDSLFVLSDSADAGVGNLDWVNLTSLRSERFAIESWPDTLGVIPGASTLFITQRHELGRISMLDIRQGELRQVTGYELNALIQ